MIKQIINYSRNYLNMMQKNNLNQNEKNDQK